MNKAIIRKVGKVGVVIAVVILSLVAITNAWVIESTESLLFTNASELPAKKVGLILGTSNKLMDGSDNPFFLTRMQTGAELYKAGKVKHLLVSGDNRSVYYNEPIKMKKALMDFGVPENAITLDYAGLRTLDSIVRCKEIFGQDDIVIISQKFHCYRALFLSKYHDIDAVAMATPPLSKAFAFKTIVREILARTKAVWDTYIINKQPKYMGQKEVIKIVE